MAKKQASEKVKIKMTLGIGLVADREDEIEFDASDVPADPTEREKWLDAEWRNWAWNFIEGGATIAKE